MSDPASATLAASSWTDTELTVRLRRGAGGTVRVDGMLCAAPVWFRWDGDTLWLVGSGASPVGEDHVRVRVDVGPGVHLRLRSVAATVVYAARGAGTRWDTDIVVAAGASLDWRPEPVVLTGRARHTSRTTVEAAADATVVLDEVVVLGRSGERPGTLTSTLDVRRDGSPLLLTTFDTSLPGWDGPAGTDGALVVATRLDHRFCPASVQDSLNARRTEPVRGRGEVAVLSPADGCSLIVATAPDVAAARSALG